jgi:hypothetical protein
LAPCELDLRGLAAPFDALQAERKILDQRFAEGRKRLKRENPALLRFAELAPHRGPSGFHGLPSTPHQDS